MIKLIVNGLAIKEACPHCTLKKLLVGKVHLPKKSESSSQSTEEPVPIQKYLNPGKIFLSQFQIKGH